MLRLKFKSVLEFDRYMMSRKVKTSSAPPMRQAAFKLMKRQQRRLKKRAYLTKRGKRPKPSAPGTSPHTMNVPGKTAYRMRLIGYEQVDASTYMVGVRALTPKKSTQNVPLTHEKGGTLQPSASMRWHKLTNTVASTQRKKDSFRAKLRNWKEDKDWFQRNSRNFWIDQRPAAHYPQRPFLVPAMVELQQDIPHLFEGFFKGF